jgi:hypothetical protein
MNRLLSVVIILCFSAFAATAQDDVKLSAEYDATLDCNYSLNGNGGIRVLSPYDNLIVMVTSGNLGGEMIKNQKGADGNYEYIVPINLDNNQEAHFVFTRQGSTIKAEFSEKRLKADRLLGYRIRSVANPIRLSYQPSVGDMYPSATEGLVEISTAFEKLSIHVPNALPFTIEEGKQERDICRGGQRAHSSLSLDHTGASRACDMRHIIVVTERRPASWQTGARPSGEFPGCSAAGTLHFHCKGGLDSISG